MLKRFFLTVCAGLIAGAVSACAGQQASVVPSGGASGAAARAKHIKLTLRLVIAGPTKRRHHRGRGAKFVSPSTNGVLIAVYPHGAAQTTQNLIASAAVDVSSGSAACKGQTGFPRTCSATLVLAATTTTGDDFVLSTYDAAPVSGSFANAHVLGAGSLSNQTISTGRANSIVVFIGGVIDSLAGNPASASLPGDASSHSMAIVIDPEDFGNNPITAGANDPFANPIVVSAVESGGTGHVKFTVNGGTPATQVTVSHSTDSVQLVYDGGGLPGYFATVSLSAPAFQGAPGATESLTLNPLLLASSNAEYTAPNLALKGSGDELAMNISEHGAAAGTVYSTTSSNCSAIADNDNVVGTGASASFHVYARGTISTPPPGTGCVIAVSDGTSTLDVAVSNAYSGVLGSPAITEYSTAVTVEEPQQITVGPDGAMWFTEGAARVGRIPASGTNPVASDFPLPQTYGTPQPTGIAPGPDGNVWWGDPQASTVGNLTTAGVATIYQAQSTTASPNGIVQGPDGAMWFTECGPTGNTIGRITTGGAASYPAMTSFATNSYLQSIVVGSDGNLWFTECGANKIGKITTAGVVTEIALPTAHSNPYGITAGPDGALWFTECTGNKIGRIPTSATQTSAITEYSGITGSNPVYITAGPDGALWFTEEGKSTSGLLSGDHVVGRLASGNIVEYAVPGNAFGIATGPDGAVWFTEINKSNIGRIAFQTSAALRHTGHARRASDAPWKKR